MHAVQVSLAEILWALTEQRIDRKDAGLMLYTLQQAATNLNQTARWHGERESVPSNRPLRALNLPDLEKRFGLPDDVDLDADPEAAPPSGNLPQSAILSKEVAAATDESKGPIVSPEISPLPEDPAVLDVVMGRRYQRALTHKGVEFQGLYYNSPELHELRCRKGSELAVEIRVDESRLGADIPGVAGGKGSVCGACPATRLRDRDWPIPAQGDSQLPETTRKSGAKSRRMAAGQRRDRGDYRE